MGKPAPQPVEVQASREFARRRFMRRCGPRAHGVFHAEFTVVQEQLQSRIRQSQKAHAGPLGIFVFELD
jgi:hypothetical protein